MLDNILLLDVGNTRIKAAQHQDEHFVPGGQLLHAGQLDINILRRISLDTKPDRIIAVNVAGEKTEHLLRQWAQEDLNKSIEFITAVRQQNGVVNAYSDPAQLGSDRWVALIAAHQLWRGSLCVIDAGSALTIDLIQMDGHHLGGYILPGLIMLQQCLLEATEIPMPINSVILSENSHLGDSTKSCIANGAMQALCGLVERTVMQFEQQAQDKVQCILTGGDSQYLADNLSISCIIEPNLVLMGLEYIASNRTSDV